MILFWLFLNQKRNIIKQQRTEQKIQGKLISSQIQNLWEWKLTNMAEVYFITLERNLQKLILKYSSVQPKITQKMSSTTWNNTNCFLNQRKKKLSNSQTQNPLSISPLKAETSIACDMEPSYNHNQSPKKKRKKNVNVT